MTFKGINNQSVELKITNYQFPENLDGDWDSNWLTIYLKVKSDVGNWQTVDPSLTTWDVKCLIDWFENLSKNIQPESKEICFTEPNLSLELMDSFNSITKTIRIKFNLESRPQFATDEKNYFVELIADNYELKCMALDLKKELEKYPERRPAENSNEQKDGRSWWQKLFSSE
jgi:hypothetical protein